jgi:ribosomal protein S18 acetylase RimI-like enzyme
LPTQLRFRRVLDAADPAGIRALVASLPGFGRDDAALAAQLAETTLDGTETYRWLIAESGGALLGYICFDRSLGSRVAFDLFWIAVLPAHQHTGLARDLIARTSAFIKTKGGTQLYAETRSTDDRAAARGFYENCGFRQVARFDGFFGPGIDKLIYRLDV